MDSHAVDFRLEGHISFWPPEEPEEPLTGNRRANLVEHRLNITRKGNLSHAKSKQNSDKIVHQVWSGEQLVERSTVELRRTIEDDAQLIWLLRMEYTMMRQKKLNIAVSSLNFTGVAFTYVPFKYFRVLLAKPRVLFECSFQLLKTDERLRIIAA